MGARSVTGFVHYSAGLFIFFKNGDGDFFNLKNT